MPEFPSGSIKYPSIQDLSKTSSCVSRHSRSRSCFAWSTLAEWTPRCVKKCGLSCWVITSLECQKLRGKRFVVSTITAFHPKYFPLGPLSTSWSHTPHLSPPGGWTGPSVLPRDHARVARLWGDCPPTGEGAARCGISEVLVWREHGQFQSEDDSPPLHRQQWGEAGIHTYIQT